MSLLEKIREVGDVKKIPEEDLPQLSEEIRDFLVAHVSHTGGHLASNLGCVELTIALHRVLDLPEDKLIWDVGHQSYVHKILTGRKENFYSLRQFDGLSGFPKRDENICDSFNTGHSSTSFSAALGMACSRDIRGTHEKIAAVIGDGAFTGGMVYEALNNMAYKKSGCLLILNDNEMSIDQNVGGMSGYLNHVRLGQPYNEFKINVERALLSIPYAGEKIAKGLKRSKDSIKQMFVPGMFFEQLGITYAGPVDGHDIKELEETFTRAINLNRPVLVHVKTIKGKGYSFAERHPSYFHGVGPFDVATGKQIDTLNNKLTYTGVFARKMVELGENNSNIVAITAAMSKGTGVDKFAKAYPERAFDVGIAEEHAVTFAAGMATSGIIPVVAIYSSFLQRAYDQIVHDVCLQNLHVIFAVDRSGLVGADGDTHQGIFDTSFLSHIPNMTVIAPKNRYDLTKALEWAVKYNGPVAIKYARGEAYYGLKEFQQPYELGKSEIIYDKGEIGILAVGNMVSQAVSLRDKLCNNGKEAALVNVRFVKPIDYNMVDQMAESCKLIVIMEEEIKNGGYGQQVMAYMLEKGYNCKVISVAIDDTFVKQGKIEELRKYLKIDCDSVYEKIMNTYL